MTVRRGSLTIKRLPGNDADYIEISVVDNLNGTVEHVVRIGLADFMEALTGKPFAPCVLVIAQPPTTND